MIGSRQKKTVETVGESRIGIGAPGFNRVLMKWSLSPSRRRNFLEVRGFQQTVETVGERCIGTGPPG